MQLGKHWYNREPGWKLDELSKLFDMSEAPFTEKLVEADTQNADAIAARRRMQTVFDELNPEGGWKAEGTGTGRLWDTDENLEKGGKGVRKQYENGVPGNTNAPGQ